MKNRKQIGNSFELLAQAYLKAKNAQVLATNWHFKGGEVDIVSLERMGLGIELVLTEVRSCAMGSKNRPIELLTKRKKKALLRSAYQLISQFEGRADTFRVDLIEFVGGRLIHTKNINLE